jgi:hypothetical protein
MLSELAQAEIINGVVLAVTLHGDLGKEKKVGAWRLLRPVLTCGSIIPLFIDPIVGHGNGLAVELAGAGAGLLVGLIASTLMRVSRNPRTGKAVSAASWPYAAVWTLIVGARMAFSYGASHWFPQQLTEWCVAHQVSADAITNGLIFMAVAMVLTRTASLALRASALPATSPTAPRTLLQHPAAR